MTSVGGGDVVAACLAAAAAWAGCPGTGRRRLAGLAPGSDDDAERSRDGLAGARPVLVAGVTVLVLATTGVTPVVVMVAGCVAWLATGLRARSHARALRRAVRAETTAACEALGAELAAGLPAAVAIDRVAGDHAVMRPVAAHVRLGGDPVAALRAAAARPGAAGLHDVAAAWSVSARAGGGLVAVLDRIVEDLRARDDLVREVEATLGPPRATARLLAVLPVLALALGAAMGGNPLAFLLGGGAGSWCLVAGVALAAAGVLWVERITDGVAR
ncbi:type II secretion system F family protein [Mumia sp. DW29H23]|uniref:type II secretion system F family protein n=1 Tax=Mumia sp. DW29H23 TaxID=3421241 RepID=UPI003D69DC1B